MGKWLLKSEPTTWSWADQIREVTTKWDGVRNYQARNHMKKMNLGDLCFFYHSGIKEPAIVGIVTIIKTYEPDPVDPSFGHVTVEVCETLAFPVTLKAIKMEPSLENLPLIKQSRLSVMPVTESEWATLLTMGSKE